MKTKKQIYDAQRYLRLAEEYKNRAIDQRLFNKESISQYHKEYAIKNKDRLKQYKKEYFQANKSAIVQKLIAYTHSTIQRKLSSYLRRRLLKALRGNYKKGSAVDLLGCSVQELKRYLENKFCPRMTWDNYGEWHIDHIRPLNSFDLQNIEHLKIACNYKNLQPLWAFDNISKGAKWQKN